MAADLGLQFTGGVPQNFFGNGTTVDSTDWIDWKVAMDLAGGKAPEVEVMITTSFATGTSARFQLVAVDSAGANPVVLDETPAIAIAGLVAPTSAGGTVMGGTRLQLRMSAKGALPTATLTHLRVRCVNVGNNTAGAAIVHLVPDAATTRPGKDYPAAF